MRSPPALFISYRRSDTAGHAGRLNDRLRFYFPADTVYYDLGSNDLGTVFPENIRHALNTAQVALIVIGPDWEREIDARLGAGKSDWVREEVELALTRRARGEMRLFPILIGRTSRLARAQLPESLHALTELEDLHFIGKDADWDSQFKQLLKDLESVPGVPPPRFQLPADYDQPFHLIAHSPSPHFHDPENRLHALRETLARSGSAAVITLAALYGMGGVGKTQLALKYSHDSRGDYAGIWWFRAETPSALELDAKACCDQCRIFVPDGEAPTQTLKRWLNRQPARWLLVYDNAEDVSSLRPALPEHGDHHVLITSRNPAWGGIATPVELSVWTAEQGADFLATRLPSRERSALIALANALQGLPLALEQAAAYLEETGMAITQYCELVAHYEHAPLLLDEGRAATGYERSVLATLSIAFDRLPTDAAQLLRLCAFLAPEPIPERLFLEGLEHLPDELAKAAGNPLAWNRAVAALLRYGIAKRVDIAALDRVPGKADVGTESALQLHRLTQDVARYCSHESDAELAINAMLLKKQLPRDVKSPIYWPRYNSLAVHVQSIERFCSVGKLFTLGIAPLLAHIATYLRYGPALFVESSSISKRIVDLCSDHLGNDHPDTLISINNYALILMAQGDHDGAKILQEKIHSVLIQTIDEANPIALALTHNFVAALHAQGESDRARKLQASALAKCEQIFGEKHPNTLTSRNNFALLLYEQKKFFEARTLQEQVLADRQKILGEQHPETLVSLNNLAGTLMAQNDLAGARRLREQALAALRQVLGDEHPDTLAVMSNLGSTLFMQNDFVTSSQLLKQALASQERVLGKEHPSTTVSAWSFFLCLMKREEITEATKLVRDSLAWLLKRDPATLGSDQARIRDSLIEMTSQANPP